MSGLFELDDFEETRAPEWVIIGDWGRCGLCGAKCSYNQGGTTTGAVCDDCALIDRCEVREHDVVIERRRCTWAYGMESAHCTRCTWVMDDRWNAEAGAVVEPTEAEIAAAVAAHLAPKHTSHWGRVHAIEDHDRLVHEQSRRRANYLAGARA